MKTFTSLLVNRLLTSAFTLIFILFAGKATACTEYNTLNNPGIEYASLAATATDNGVFINWVTVSELNNSHFEVERSTDMKSFKTVAMVLDGFAATGSKGKTYKFKEASAEIKNGKTVYYRLKQIDNDNQVHYSAVMAVQMNTTVTVYPNSQTLLSKQSTSSMGKTKMPAVSSTELSAGILNACEIILGSELYAPKLNIA